MHAQLEEQRAAREQREVQAERREDQAERRHYQMMAALTGGPVERPPMVTLVQVEENSQDSLRAMVPVESIVQLLRYCYSKILIKWGMKQIFHRALQENFDSSGHRVFFRAASARHATLLTTTSGVDWPDQLFVTIQEKMIGGEYVSVFVLAP
jgi:hypothetical protein